MFTLFHFCVLSASNRSRSVFQAGMRIPDIGQSISIAHTSPPNLMSESQQEDTLTKEQNGRLMSIVRNQNMNYTEALGTITDLIDTQRDTIDTTMFSGLTETAKQITPTTPVGARTPGSQGCSITRTSTFKSEHSQDATPNRKTEKSKKSIARSRVLMSGTKSHEYFLRTTDSSGRPIPPRPFSENFSTRKSNFQVVTTEDFQLSGTKKSKRGGSGKSSIGILTSNGIIALDKTQNQLLDCSDSKSISSAKPDENFAKLIEEQENLSNIIALLCTVARSTGPNSKDYVSTISRDETTKDFRLDLSLNLSLLINDLDFKEVDFQNLKNSLIAFDTEWGNNLGNPQVTPKYIDDGNSISLISPTSTKGTVSLASLNSPQHIMNRAESTMSLFDGLQKENRVRFGGQTETDPNYLEISQGNSLPEEKPRDRSSKVAPPYPSKPPVTEEEYKLKCQRFSVMDLEKNRKGAVERIVRQYTDLSTLIQSDDTQTEDENKSKESISLVNSKEPCSEVGTYPVSCDITTIKKPYDPSKPPSKPKRNYRKKKDGQSVASGATEIESAMNDSEFIESVTSERTVRESGSVKDSKERSFLNDPKFAKFLPQKVGDENVTASTGDEMNNTDRKDHSLQSNLETSNFTVLSKGSFRQRSVKAKNSLRRSVKRAKQNVTSFALGCFGNSKRRSALDCTTKIEDSEPEAPMTKQETIDPQIQIIDDEQESASTELISESRTESTYLNDSVQSMVKAEITVETLDDEAASDKTEPKSLIEPEMLSETSISLETSVVSQETAV